MSSSHGNESFPQEDLVEEVKEARWKLTKNTGALTRVKVRIEFSKIIDINCKTNQFCGDIMIEASWLEPVLRYRSEEELTALEERYGEIWHPRLVILNLDRAPQTDEVWYEIDSSSQMTPIVTQKRRLTAGVFYLKLKFHLFPFDYQDIVVKMVSELSAREVLLDTSSDSLSGKRSSVSSEGFRDLDEFALFDTVRAELRAHEVYGESYETQPITAPTECKALKKRLLSLDKIKRLRKYEVRFTCFVSRNHAFWITNTFSVLILIHLLSFAPFAFDATNTTGRMGVINTLLLTTVAKKLSLREWIPCISYMTCLDRYILSVIGFLTLQSTHFVIQSNYVKIGDKNSINIINKMDLYVGMSLLGILILFNVVFFIVIAYRRKLKLKRKDLQNARLLNARTISELTRRETVL